MTVTLYCARCRDNQEHTVATLAEIEGSSGTLNVATRMHHKLGEEYYVCSNCRHPRATTIRCLHVPTCP